MFIASHRKTVVNYDAKFLQIKNAIRIRIKRRYKVSSSTQNDKDKKCTPIVTLLK